MHLERKAHLVERFVTARKASSADPEQMLHLCTELLDDPDIEVCWALVS